MVTLKTNNSIEEPSINQPLVSVLMTAYNRENYIAEAIQSVLDSTYKNFELIVVDDGSKDNTVSIAKGFEEKDSRIKVYINERNLKDYPNRNRAASYAKGEFLMYVDSDDMILKDGLENCVATMLRFADCGIGMYSFYNRGVAPYRIESKDAIRNHFFKQSFLIIGPGGTIIRRKFFEEIQGYPVSFGPANDMYFNLKAASLTNIAMLPFEFLFYRFHDGQEQNNYFSYLHNNYNSLKAALNDLKLPLTNKERKWLQYKNNRRFILNLLKYYFKTRDIKKTKEALKMTTFNLKDAFTAVFH